MAHETFVVIALLTPLIGAALWFWVGPRFGEKLVSVGSVATVTVSFLSTIGLFLTTKGQSEVHLFPWISLTPSLTLSFSFLFDPLSLSLGLVVTGIGSLIHLYATGYMHGDPGFGRFFSYLNLFIFSMLMLIWSATLPGIFLGWEGVGLCSYLLISFWFTDLANASAGMKAFVVNRVGDFGFLLAMFAIFKVFGTLSIPEFLEMIQGMTWTSDRLFWTGLACFGFILGATGKSAQIPLYVWLPDAMAGPTPVSALIHAATMVTAGVYLVCRLQPLFVLHGNALELVAFLGGLTAFFAATIAVFQNDIKKVLAYSTISQLGYMFLAVGLMAPVAAYFHLITHACFKALLFLGAGSVIHGLHHEQDMRKMGGLRKQMPVTFWTMTIGVFAIAGIPPLSGFVSKDEILHFAAHSHRWWLIFFAFASAFLTAFYMGRLWVMTFFGRERGKGHAHESPWRMTSVLVVLSILSVVAGALNWPAVWGGNAMLHHYLGHVVDQVSDAGNLAGTLKLAAFSVLLGALGLSLAYWRYRDYSEERKENPYFGLIRHKYYVDEIYEKVFVVNLRRLGEIFWRIIDVRCIDGALNGAAQLAMQFGSRFRRLQTGLLQQYVLWVWIGVLLLLIGAWTMKV